MADTDNDKKPEAKAKAEPSGGGMASVLVAAGIVTIVAVGLGAGFGTMIGGKIKSGVAEQSADEHKEPVIASATISGDAILQKVEPVITNLAAPTDVWIRLETAMIFKNGDLENPEVTAAEIRQDMTAYLRTVSLAQLEGPSALQHLREDLNERVQLRTDNHVSELVIQTMVLQ